MIDHFWPYYPPGLFAVTFVAFPLEVLQANPRSSCGRVAIKARKSSKTSKVLKQFCLPDY